MQKHYCDNCKYEDVNTYQLPCCRCDNDPEDGEPTMWKVKEDTNE